MNFSQRFGIFCLVLITVVYVYFSFFNKEGFDFFGNGTQYSIEETPSINGNEQPSDEKQKDKSKTVKIYITDSNGKLRSVNRNCNLAVEKSCFEYAIKELISAPTKWEKSKGLNSEIPPDTKILSIREDSRNILIDLSSNFESGGGAESTYTRVRQLIKTANSNTKLPVFLYVNGKQANVIGGEGVMIKQPLNERSLDE